MGEGGRPGEPAWWSDYVLAATSEEIDPEEIRSYWNSKEAPTLFSLADSAPQIEIGPLYAHEENAFDAGPARRIFNLLFLRGTTPKYVLPVVGDTLIAEIVAASQPTNDDQVGSASAPDGIEKFLTEHRGWSLVPIERVN